MDSFHDLQKSTQFKDQSEGYPSVHPSTNQKLGGTPSVVSKLTKGALHPAFKDFDDLINSTSLQDQAIHGFVTSLLQRLFKQSSGQITMDSQCETKQNHQLITDNWEFIQLILHVPNRIQNNQKLVKQTLKYIFDYLNQKYSFQKQIKLNSKKICIRNGSASTSYISTTIDI